MASYLNLDDRVLHLVVVDSLFSRFTKPRDDISGASFSQEDLSVAMSPHFLWRSWRKIHT